MVCAFAVSRPRSQQLSSLYQNGWISLQNQYAIRFEIRGCESVVVVVLVVLVERTPKESTTSAVTRELGGVFVVVVVVVEGDWLGGC